MWSLVQVFKPWPTVRKVWVRRTFICFSTLKARSLWLLNLSLTFFFFSPSQTKNYCLGFKLIIVLYGDRSSRFIIQRSDPTTLIYYIINFDILSTNQAWIIRCTWKVSVSIPHGSLLVEWGNPSRLPIKIKINLYYV